MKNKILLSSMVVFVATIFTVSSSVAMAATSEIVVADFDTGDKPNNIGGDFGAWDKDPNDDSQSCEMSFSPDDALGDPVGYSIQLDYDVDSPNAAYNGFWLHLKGEDVSDYNTLTFYIKGNGNKNYTENVKIELKDSRRTSAYLVSDIRNKWKKVSIPFEKFRSIGDWANMKEFVIVFDDVNSRPKTGTIYIDHITFMKE